MLGLLSPAPLGSGWGVAGGYSPAWAKPTYYCRFGPGSCPGCWLWSLVAPGPGSGGAGGRGPNGRLVGGASSWAELGGASGGAVAWLWWVSGCGVRAVCVWQLADVSRWICGAAQLALAGLGGVPLSVPLSELTLPQDKAPGPPYLRCPWPVRSPSPLGGGLGAWIGGLGMWGAAGGRWGGLASRVSPGFCLGVGGALVAAALGPRSSALSHALGCSVDGVPWIPLGLERPPGSH